MAKWRNGSDRGNIYGELLLSTVDVLPSEAGRLEGEGWVREGSYQQNISGALYYAQVSSLTTG